MAHVVDVAVDAVAEDVVSPVIPHHLTPLLRVLRAPMATLADGEASDERAAI